jgi:TonB family protein
VLPLLLTLLLGARAAPGDTAAVDDTTALAPGPHGTPAGAADTSLRVPGSRLRFGLSQEQLVGRGSFAAVRGTVAPGFVARRGPAVWFGVQTEATLLFRGDRLQRVRFSAKNVPAHVGDYVEDELRRLAYRRRCETLEPVARDCEWTGAARVRLKVAAESFDADIEPSPAAPKPRFVAAARETVPLLPEVLTLAPRGIADHPGAPELVDPAPLRSPAYPRRAREAGVQGRVWVRALVDTSGAVIETRVTRSIAELDSAAVEIVRRLRFRPFLAGGRPARARVDVPITFTVR